MSSFRKYYIEELLYIVYCIQHKVVYFKIQKYRRYVSNNNNEESQIEIIPDKKNQTAGCSDTN